MTTIRQYSIEFKQDAIKYVESHPELPISQVAEYLGMPKILCMAGSKPTAESSVMGTLLFPGPSQMPRRNLPVFAVRTAIFKTP